MALALAHLVKLGVTVTRAQSSVRDFVDKVVTWVLEVKSAFDSTIGGHFTWTTWKNLSDKRWTRIGNGMMIGTEIEEFNERINEAKGLFMDLTLINLTGGIDAIIRGLWMLFERQDAISREIEKIREKQKEQFTYIMDELEAQKQTEARRLFLSQKLSSRVVTNPMYDQQGKLPCDDNTRTQVLADIRQWIYDFSANSPNFLWLTGDPGSGKSAITASIARECKDKKILWAQYFINRNNVETTNPNSYFPSIARQFADHSTDVEVTIHDALKKKPSLMDRISPEQAAELFVDAIGTASKLFPDRPVVVVIDGLDETERDRLKDTATIFAHLFRSLAIYLNVKVLVSSRTEDDIRNPFARHMNFVKHIYLDTAEKSSIDDVSAFLRRKVADIVEANDLNWTEWPGDARMDALTRRASGLFIWAVTVTKFIQEQIDTMGTECLNEVLDMLDIGTLGDINTLYSIILRQTYKTNHASTQDQSHDHWEYQKFRAIVGAIVTLCEPMSLEDLAAFLDLRRTPKSAPVDIINFVRRLRTVLVAGTDAIDQKTVPRLHKSFFEFITSPHAEKQFRIDLELTNSELAVRCLSKFCDTDSISTYQPWVVASLPTQLCYAFRYWSNHFHKAKGAVSGLIIDNNLSLTPDRCRDILEHFSNESRPEPLHISFSQNHSRMHIKSDAHAMTWNLTSGMEIKDVHSAFEAHKDYVSTVVFSPDSKHLISGSADKTAILWDVESKNAIATFRGHSRGIHCAKFSPNGHHFASASEDFSIRLWDLHTRTLVASDKSHTRPVRCIAFSPDGKQIASGSDDRKVRLWNWENSGISEALLPDHRRPVTSVAYSPDNRFIVSSSEDSTVQIWNAQTRCMVGEPIAIIRPFCLQFSPRGNYIAAIGGENAAGIYLFKPNSTPDLVFHGRNLSPRVKRICSLAFSPDESSLVFGCDDHSIRLVNFTTPGRPSLVYTGHSGWVMAVGVSPDGKYLASGSVDNKVHVYSMPVVQRRPTSCFARISPKCNVALSSSSQKACLWNLQTGTCSEITGFGNDVNGNWIQNVCFSPDGGYMAGVLREADRAIVHLWDNTTSSKLTFPIETGNSGIPSVGFTKDSGHLFAKSGEEPVGTWEVKNGEPVASYPRDIASETAPPNFFGRQSEPALTLQSATVPSAADPCVKVAGKVFVPPADALACYRAFPFNETLRQNVLNNVARVFDFFTFEDYYLNSPPPFQESTDNIRASIAKLNATQYRTDYDFSKALYDFTTQLNDGHTRWFPNCYNAYQNVLPAPPITIEVNGAQGVYIAFDSVDFISLLGADYTGYFDEIGFDWKRLQGAQLLKINGQDPYDYVDTIARTVSGNYLDHGVRVNSVFSSYRISGTDFSQRLGDLAGPLDVTQTSLTFELIVVNSTVRETVTVPYLASYIGLGDFTDSKSFWEINCAANEDTNGVDLKSSQASLTKAVATPRRLAKGNIIDKSNSKAIGLPPQFIPSLPFVAGSEGVIKSFLLPDNETGVMFVGSFEGDFDGFQADVVNAITAFKEAGVTQLLIDLTNNGGGFVCLGQFLHQYLSGSKLGYPGFQSTVRANPLAQKIVAADISLGLNDEVTFYSADNCGFSIFTLKPGRTSSRRKGAFLNGTQMLPSDNYISPSSPFTVNGRSDPTSQRFHDTCELAFSQEVPADPPFDLRKVAIGDVSTLMNERHNTKIAVFGGKPGEDVQFKGMAGNQVLEWVDLDTEIKTAGVKNTQLENCLELLQ
ncbi:hypothetical protein H0H93_011655 [Arthromyces matolae]|nr:hypothetical protein H0H93_011655 [Arthromyces matolae]